MIKIPNSHLLYTGHCSGCFSCIILFNLHSHLRDKHCYGAHFIDGRPRLREVKWFAQVCSGSRGQSRALLLPLEFFYTHLLFLLQRLRARFPHTLSHSGDILQSQMFLHPGLKKLDTLLQTLLVKLSFALCDPTPLG